MQAPGFVSTEWPRSQEAREVFAVLMHRSTHMRKPFGLLERPTFQEKVDEYEYKVFVSGKSGVGKTSTVAHLTAHDVPRHHSETPGIQTSVVYWPAKITNLDRVVLFKLNFWDAGESALKKFDHVLPTCKFQVDAVLFTFSFVDKSSFEDLPQHMSRILEPTDNVCKFVIGTKLDMYSQNEVTQQGIRDFESQWRVPVLGIRNVPSGSTSDQQSDIPSVAPILNYMCDKLWLRDQVLAGNAAPPQTEPPPMKK